MESELDPKPLSPALQRIYDAALRFKKNGRSGRVDAFDRAASRRRFGWVSPHSPYPPYKGEKMDGVITLNLVDLRVTQKNSEAL